jgi:hypothetical protein
MPGTQRVLNVLLRETSSGFPADLSHSDVLVLSVTKRRVIVAMYLVLFVGILAMVPRASLEGRKSGLAVPVLGSRANTLMAYSDHLIRTLALF